MGVNRLKIGLFAMLMLVGVGAFAQNTMLRPASGKSGTVIKPKPKAQPPKTITPPAAQPTAVQPASNTKKTSVFLENAETFSYDKDLMADGQLLKGNVRFRHDMAPCIVTVPIFLNNEIRSMPMVMCVSCKVIRYLSTAMFYIMMVTLKWLVYVIMYVCITVQLD